MIHLLVNAVVRTLDDSLPVAQALAVKDGRIVEVGGTDEILWLREDDYEVIDLAGRAIVPGRTDSGDRVRVGGVLAAGNAANFLVLFADPGEDPAAGAEGLQVVERWVDGARIMVRP